MGDRREAIVQMSYIYFFRPQTKDSCIIDTIASFCSMKFKPGTICYVGRIPNLNILECMKAEYRITDQFADLWPSMIGMVTCRYPDS